MWSLPSPLFTMSSDSAVNLVVETFRYKLLAAGSASSCRHLFRPRPLSFPNHSSLVGNQAAWYLDKQVTQHVFWSEGSMIFFLCRRLLD